MNLAEENFPRLRFPSRASWNFYAQQCRAVLAAQSGQQYGPLSLDSYYPWKKFRRLYEHRSRMAFGATPVGVSPSRPVLKRISTPEPFLRRHQQRAPCLRVPRTATRSNLVPAGECRCPDPGRHWSAICSATMRRSSVDPSRAGGMRAKSTHRRRPPPGGWKKAHRHAFWVFREAWRPPDIAVLAGATLGGGAFRVQCHDVAATTSGEMRRRTSSWPANRPAQKPRMAPGVRRAG